MYRELRRDTGAILLRKQWDLKDVETIEAHAMPDHIHMLIKIPLKKPISYFMGYLKVNSSLMIPSRYEN